MRVTGIRYQCLSADRHVVVARRARPAAASLAALLREQPGELMSQAHYDVQRRHPGDGASWSVGLSLACHQGAPAGSSIIALRSRPSHFQLRKLDADYVSEDMFTMYLSEMQSKQQQKDGTLIA